MTAVTTGLEPSARSQPHQFNSHIMALTPIPLATLNIDTLGCYNMLLDSPSPAASSNISTGQNLRYRSYSPYDILPASPSHSAPSLRLTLSNDGSNTSGNSSWVPVDVETGSIGNVSGSTRQRHLQRPTSTRLNPSPGRYIQHTRGVDHVPQYPPRSSAPFSPHPVTASNTYSSTVEDVPTVYTTSLDCEGSLGQGKSIPHSSGAAYQHNPPRSQENSADFDGCIDSQSGRTSISGVWNGGFENFNKPAAEAGDGNHNVPVSFSFEMGSQIAATGPSTPNDTRSWWLDRILYNVHQSNAKLMLGIPPSVALMPSSVRTQCFGVPAKRIKTAASDCSRGTYSSIASLQHGYNIVPAVRHPGATLPDSSTSSKNSYSPSRVSGGLSIQPASGLRGLKRPMEDEEWEVPKSTSKARYAAEADLPDDIERRGSNNLVSRATRRVNNGLWAVDSGLRIQPQLAPSRPADRHLRIDSMDGRGFTHEQPKAEEFSLRLPTSSAEYLAHLYRTTHQLEPENGFSPELHENVDEHSFEFQIRRFPSNNTETLDNDSHNAIEWNISDELPFDAFCSPSGLGALPASPGISQNVTDENMEGNGTGDGSGSDFNSFRAPGDINNHELSSYPATPSPVLSPSESPGIRPSIPYGPAPPPQMDPAAQQFQFHRLGDYTFSRGATNEGVSNALFNEHRFLMQQEAQAEISMHWPEAPPCIYPQPQPPLPGQPDSGEGYEAEDEQIGMTITHMHHQIPQKKKRSAFPEGRRRDVGLVRKLGACLRCQYLRESCDQGNPCGNCLKVEGKQKIWANMACQRMKLTEAQLFRGGNSKFKQERAVQLPTPIWKTHAPRKYLLLGRPLPIAAKYWGQQQKYPEIKIQCQEFIPKPGDLLFESWTEDGEERKIVLPAFAACDIQDVSLAVRNYVMETFDLFKNDMVSEEHDPLVRLVFQEAIRYIDAHQCSIDKKGVQVCMLKDAIKIWILTRLAYEGFGIISGNEEFGLNVINNPRCPYDGTVPIPPILDHQLDTVGIEEMIRLKGDVLKALKSRIERRKKSEWYEVFLTVFVLLHNLEYISRKQYLYAKRHERTWASNGEKSIEFFRITWMAKWEEAANMLIKHFQIALKGAVPFTFNWEGSGDGKGGTGHDGAKMKGRSRGKQKADLVAEAREKAGMDDEAVKFMREVCTLIRANASDFRNLRQESERREYEKDMVWVSQLFMDVE